MKGSTYVEIQYRDINVVEQLRVVFDRVAAGEEDDDLLLGVPFQKRKQQQEPLVRFANEVALFKEFGGGCGLVRIDVDVERPGSKRYACEIGDLGGLSGREEH